MQYIINTLRRSPNHESRTKPIKMIVLHATAGPLQSSLNWLCSPASRVSAHYVIDKSGVIYQLVDDTRVAWHAGVSAWNGETDINGVSLGIELVNDNTGRDPYPQAQYDAAAWLCRTLIARYGITRDWVTRHLDVAQPHGRKSDPAGFPWPQFIGDLFPSDPFDAWGDVARPQGDRRGWAIPRMWLQHKTQLGKCIAPEWYPLDEQGKDIGLSFAFFERGYVYYRKALDKAFVVLF